MLDERAAGYLSTIKLISWKRWEGWIASFRACRIFSVNLRGSRGTRVGEREVRVVGAIYLVQRQDLVFGTLSQVDRQGRVNRFVPVSSLNHLISSGIDRVPVTCHIGLPRTSKANETTGGDIFSPFDGSMSRKLEIDRENSTETPPFPFSTCNRTRWPCRWCTPPDRCPPFTEISRL